MNNASVRKTYLVANTLNVQLPSDFICSRNKRYIEVRECKAIYNGSLIGDITVHADFIERDHYLDYFCCFANDTRSKYKKYEYNGYRDSFNIWFKDFTQNDLDFSKNSSGVNSSNNYFVIEFLLIY